MSREKSTDELERVLGETHPGDFGSYLSENAESVVRSDRPFAEYMRAKIREKGRRQQDVFLDADIPERYGYKLLSEEKRTRKRDVLLRICYAAHFTIAETQRALKLYGLPELYAKLPRDAALMIAFNERPGSVLDVNAFLKGNGLEPLRTSGVQE